jgi:hypothetical protein
MNHLDHFARLHGLLATFGEVESRGTSMRKIEKLPLSSVAVFLAL